MPSIAPVSAAAARERLMTVTMEAMDRGGTDQVEDHHLQASDKSTCHEMDAPHPTMMVTQILVTVTTMAPQDWEEVASGQGQPLVDCWATCLETETTATTDNRMLVPGVEAHGAETVGDLERGEVAVPLGVVPLVASPLVDSLLDRLVPELHLGSVELAGVKDGTMKWKRVLNVNMQNFTDSILHWILGTSSEGQYIHVLHYSNVKLSYSGKNGEKKEQIEL